jgi:putative ABC transport system permease protein
LTLEQAHADMDAISRNLEKQYPDEDTDIGVGIVRMQDDLVSDVRPVLIVLLVAVVLVLLIGCANVANLLLARATGRAREISVRNALGATRLRLVRQLLTESILLALCGGISGLLLAWWAVPVLLALSPPEISSFQHIGLNSEMLALSVVVSVISGLLFGLAPALHASGSSLSGSLKEGERGSTSSRGKVRSGLAVAEVGLSLVLLIGAGLMIKSFVRLMNVDPGFDPNHLLVFSVGLPPSSTVAQQDAFYQQVEDRLRTVPGVQSVGAVSRLPLAGGNSGRGFTIPGSNEGYNADIRVTTPGYFETMGIPLLKGRRLTQNDSQNSALVAVVNETLAKTVFPGQDPIGKYILDFGPAKDKLQIVGVIGNVRHTGLEKAPRSEVYLPFGEAHWPSVFMVVRSKTTDALALTADVQSAVWSVDRDIPLANLRTMQDVVANSVLRRRFTMVLLAIFAGLAMLLSAVGLYGVMSYTVSQRTHEIGIRMALGARTSDVLKLVVGQGMGLTAAGLALGIVASLAATRLLSGLLFGVSATDPLTFGLVSALLAAVAMIANYVPARRAVQVDPMVALRDE